MLRPYQEKAVNLIRCALSVGFVKPTTIDPKYAVSRSGIVYRLLPGPGTYPGKIIKPWIESHGYCKVTINRLHYFVHRLVLATFVGEPKNGEITNHKDGNKRNNSITNLEWATYSENMAHAHKTGLNFSYFGEKHPLSKLSNKDVSEIKEALKNNYRGLSASLARKYGVTKHAISDIKRGKSWARCN